MTGAFPSGFAGRFACRFILASGVFCLQDASAQLFSRRFDFLADRLGRACTKMAISCEGTVPHSTYNAKTWNNSPAFRLACDTIGTGKAIYWQPSPFLHNLSSILYTGGRGDLPGCQVRTVRRLPSRHALCRPPCRVVHRAASVRFRSVVSAFSGWRPVGEPLDEVALKSLIAFYGRMG